MIERSLEVEVTCSAQEVYELWGDMQNIPRWMPLVKEVKILPGDENLSHWKFGLGAPLLTEWTSRITQRIPRRLIAWESVSGLLNWGCAEFFSTERGCRLRLTLAFDLPGGIVGAFLKSIRSGALVRGESSGELKALSIPDRRRSMPTSSWID